MSLKVTINFVELINLFINWQYFSILFKILFYVNFFHFHPSLNLKFSPFFIFDKIIFLSFVLPSFHFFYLDLNLTNFFIYLFDTFNENLQYCLNYIFKIFIQFVYIVFNLSILDQYVMHVNILVRSNPNNFFIFVFNFMTILKILEFLVQVVIYIA